MVKVINPLFSYEAYGRLGGLVYQRGSAGNIVKGHTPQRYKPSPLQLQWNYAFGRASDEWRKLTDQEKADLNIIANKRNMSGYNLYIKQHIKDFIT